MCIRDSSCSLQFHCAEWSCGALSDSPRHRIESGKDWPVKSPSGKLPGAVQADSSHTPIRSTVTSRLLHTSPRCCRAHCIHRRPEYPDMSRIEASNRREWSRGPTEGTRLRSRSSLRSCMLFRGSMSPGLAPLFQACCKRLGKSAPWIQLNSW